MHDRNRRPSRVGERGQHVRRWLHDEPLGRHGRRIRVRRLYPGDGRTHLRRRRAATCDTTGANGEQVTVTGSASSSSKQGWLPNDRITLTSTAGTTLTAPDRTLYNGAFAGTLANCSLATGPSKYQEMVVRGHGRLTGTRRTPSPSTPTTRRSSSGTNPSTGGRRSRHRRRLKLLLADPLRGQRPDQPDRSLRDVDHHAQRRLARKERLS